eukprot:3749883-Alexandrium_andersonii.AAC.1
MIGHVSAFVLTNVKEAPDETCSIVDVFGDGNDGGGCTCYVACTDVTRRTQTQAHRSTSASANTG